MWARIQGNVGQKGNQVACLRVLHLTWHHVIDPESRSPIIVAAPHLILKPWRQRKPPHHKGQFWCSEQPGGVTRTQKQIIWALTSGLWSGWGITVGGIPMSFTNFTNKNVSLPTPSTVPTSCWPFPLLSLLTLVYPLLAISIFVQSIIQDNLPSLKSAS